MGIKSRLRSIMFPTQRYFDSSMKKLHRHFKNEDKALSDILKATNNLSGRQDLILEKLSRCESELKRIEQSVRILEASHEYANLEYLALKKSKILLAGWYGASNCGDELMMRSILKCFSGKGARIAVMLWNDPCYDAGDLPGFVDIIHYPRSIWHLEQLANQFDVLVWGGGAILDDKQYTDDPHNFNTGNLFVRLSEAMLNRGKKVFALGLSSNSTFSSQEYIRRMQNIVSQSAFFSLRDGYSLQALEQAGVDVSHVSLCEDVVFADSDLNKARDFVHQRQSDIGGARYKVGIVFLCFNENKEHNRSLLESLSTYLKGRFADFEIELIPFYGRNNSDLAYLRQLKQSLGSPEWLSIGRYSTNLLGNSLLDCDATINYRYHAALISGTVGIRSIFVCQDSHPHYPNKIAHLADLFQYRDNTVNISDFDSASFDTYFEKLLPEGSRPSLDVGLLSRSHEWLVEQCDIIHKAALA